MLLPNLNKAMCYAAASETFRIVNAVLYNYGKKQGDVYLLALRGTDQSFDPNDVLSLPTCVKASAGKPNNYYEAVKNEMLNSIPKDSDVVIIGHSLGGMVAQQIVADEDIKNHCNILNLLTIGSPFVMIKGRTCPLHRIADRFDAIAGLSPAGIGNIFLGGGLIYENGGYFGRPVLAHTDSYRYSQKWFKYDCFGVKNGGHTLEIL